MVPASCLHSSSLRRMFSRHASLLDAVAAFLQCEPGQISVAPFSAVKSTRGTFMVSRSTCES